MRILTKQTPQAVTTFLLLCLLAFFEIGIEKCNAGLLSSLSKIFSCRTPKTDQIVQSQYTVPRSNLNLNVFEYDEQESVKKDAVKTRSKSKAKSARGNDKGKKPEQQKQLPSKQLVMPVEARMSTDSINNDGEPSQKVDKYSLRVSRENSERYENSVIPIEVDENEQEDHQGSNPRKIRKFRSRTPLEPSSRRVSTSTPIVLSRSPSQRIVPQAPENNYNIEDHWQPDGSLSSLAAADLFSKSRVSDWTPHSFDIQDPQYTRSKSADEARQMEAQILSDLNAPTSTGERKSFSNISPNPNSSEGRKSFSDFFSALPNKPRKSCESSPGASATGSYASSRITDKGNSRSISMDHYHLNDKKGKKNVLRHHIKTSMTHSPTSTAKCFGLRVNLADDINNYSGRSSYSSNSYNI